MQATTDKPAPAVPTSQAAFTGWIRDSKRSPWRAVIDGENEGDVWRRLLDVPGPDKCVTAAGVDPNTKPQAPRRRRL